MDELQRVARLEERLAWLERHVVEQDKAMLEMSEDIGRLRRELQRRLDRPAEFSGGAGEAPADERPPHY